MRARLLTGLMLVAIVPFQTGCATMSNTGKGAAVGGALGAGSGAIISKATGGKAGPGAVIGGIAGAVLGGAIGNEEDRREKEALESQVRQAEDRQAYAASVQMSIDDVIAMNQARPQSDDLIINQIRTTNSTFQLTPQDINRLGSSGVSDKVIIEMQNRRPEAYAQRPARLPRHMIVAPPPQPVYIYQPLPPPPPPVGWQVGVRVR